MFLLILRAVFTVLLFTPEAAASAPWVPDGNVTSGEYLFHSVFADGAYLLFWRIDGETISCAVSAGTTGWIGLGIDPVSQMDQADMILGWVSEDGECTLLDCYSVGAFGPHQPDVELGGTTDFLEFAGSIRDGTTTLEFRRPLISVDKFDKPISPGVPLRIIWSFATTKNLAAMHIERGSGEIMIREGVTRVQKKILLWPYHAALTVSGSVLLSIGVSIALFRRTYKGWLKAHRAVNSVAAVVLLTGLGVAAAMVTQSGRPHFGSWHAFTGGIAVLTALGNVCLGYIQVRTKARGLPLRGIHRPLGRLILILAVVSFLSGVVFIGMI